MLKQFIKRQLKIRFPGIITAYHRYQGKKHYQRMRLERSSIGFMFKGIPAMQNGTFEPEETKTMIEYLKNTDVFIDVGANTGYFSCIALNRGIKTVAIEPLTENLNILYENLKVNGWNNAEVFPVGLGGQAGIAQLYGGNTGASLVAGWAGNSELCKRAIPLATLDTIIEKRFSQKRLFIKIDVEGAEYEVLKGSINTLAMDPAPVWMAEVCLAENRLKGINPNFLNTFEVFWKNGYQAYSLGNEIRMVKPEDARRWVRNGARDFGYVNYLFKKEKSQDFLRK